MVIQLSKRLTTRPTIEPLCGLLIRHFRVDADTLNWLRLRQQVFADQRPPVGHWDMADFEREMVLKPWWNPQCTWLAEPTQQDGVIGSVTLAARGPRQRPVIHWLMVHPAWQRRGMGRLLVAHLEQACWDAGWRCIRLETDTGWSAATALYQSLAYTQTNV